MTGALEDLRHGMRLLVRAPGLAAVMILTLAVGIGGNTALFSIVHGVILSPFPFRGSERLVMLWETNPGKDVAQRWVAPARYREWEEQATSFEELAFYKPFYKATLTGAGNSEKLQQVPVSHNFLSFLGVEPQLGRDFESEEEARQEAVAIVSYGLWRRRFGGAPDVLGRAIQMDGRTYEIIGVLPESFRIAGLLPLGFEFSGDKTVLTPPTGMVWSARSYGNLDVLARLEPGRTVEEAQAEMSGIAGRLALEHPATDTGWDVAVVPLRTQVLGSLETGLLLLWGSVGLVLLIACSNVSSLLLARATARRKEMAIRAAIGASRLRVIRQLLAEGLVLGLLGGAAGVLLAYWSIDALMNLSPETIPRGDNVSINLTVLGGTLCLSLFAVVLFGLPPALQASRIDIQRTLNQSGTRGGSPGGQWSTQGVLVIMEVALAFGLVVGSGLLVRSFIHLWAIPPGFDPDRRLTLRVDMPREQYPDSRARISFLDRLIPRVEAVPGVTSVGVINQPPLGGPGESFRIWLAGESYDHNLDIPTADFRVANREYFGTMGIRLVQGRLFDEEAAAPDSAGEIVVNRTMVRRYWPDRDPLGQTLSIDGPGGVRHRVVGVVEDVRHYGLDQPAKPEFYLPYPIVAWHSVSLVIRTEIDPLPLVDAIQAEIWANDPNIVAFDIATMEQRLAGTLAGRRFSMTLLGLFAFTALALAALGLYSVLAFSVSQRTHEIGIRMALGARKGNIIALVLRHGMGLVVTGLTLGLAGAYALTRAMASLLHGVEPTDPVTLVAAGAGLFAVGLLACYVPARRAASVDPMAVLHAE